MKYLIYFTIISLITSLQLFAQAEKLQTFSEINSLGDSEFGKSVSSAGDVNNDGFDDFIVGAPAYNSKEGRAYIYLGGSILNSGVDLTLSAEGFFDEFGTSVSSAGDVNNDGYDDVIVGAPGYENNKGRAYIYFGSSQGSLNADPDIILTGEYQWEFLGYSVSGAGDVNNDGYDDVIVGAYGNTLKGTAYIYFGGSSMNSIADVKMTGLSDYEKFGYSVSSAGDVNNDGYSDVIVGAPGYSSNTGRAYIFLGASGTSMNNAAALTMTGENTGNEFGNSVSSAGFVNNDNYSDFIIGAAKYESAKGRAYIYMGGASLNNIADVVITGDNANDNFGSQVSSAGDLNNDGFTDIIIGAESNNFETGFAKIYYGATGVTMDNISDGTLTGENTYDKFSVSVSSAGDLNNDGFDDIIVGASNYSKGLGKTYIYKGASTFDINVGLTITGDAGFGNQFGTSISGAGDINNDGIDDIIIGAPKYNNYTGRAYIYFGSNSSTPNNNVDLVLTGESEESYFGYSVATAGDVNNDGYDDVIVGAYNYNTGRGRAYIYYGGSSMNSNADVTLTGTGIGDFFGKSVSPAGDVNNDGYDDVIVGAYGYSGNTGRAYIYYGGSSMNSTVDVTLTGESTAIRFGTSVSSAGDVNNDNFDDVIVGAEGYSNFKGRAYLFFGGSSMNTIADVTMTGENSSDYFGMTVSGAGDINNDAYHDVMVTSSNYNADKGRVYIYLGAPSNTMNNIADIILTGESGTYFGTSLSDSDDLNNDGVGDLLIGTGFYNSLNEYAYAYFGESGSLMNSSPDISMGTELQGAKFGRSVAYVGDFNNDTQPDFMVGAPNYPGNGQVFLYTMPPLIISDDFAISILQNETYTFSVEDFAFNDPAYGTPQGINITSLETNGFLLYDGNDVIKDVYYPDLDKLLFIPVPNDTGSNYASFRFKAKNSFDIFGNEGTVTINVTGYNTPPLAGSNSFTIDEDTQKTFSTSEFNYTDKENSPMQQIQITAFPQKGTLYNDKNKDGIITNSELIFQDGVITKADLDNRQLKFKPDQNGFGAPYTLFNFKVHDGTEYSTSYYSITINVEQVNDPPAGINNSVTIARSAPYIFSVSDFTFIDVDGHTFAGIQITQTESAGDLRYNGAAVATNTICDDVRKLMFTPEPDKTGSPYATFKFKVKDSSNEFSTAQYNMNINVSASINQAPYIYINRGISVTEGGTYTLSNSILKANDPDGSDYSVTYNIVHSPAYGTLSKGSFLMKTDRIEVSSFTQEDLANNRVTYTHNGSEVTYDKFIFTLEDEDGATSQEYDFNITIVGTNEPPVIAQLPSIQLMEDETYTLDLTTWYSFISDAETPDHLLIYDLSIEEPAISISPVYNNICTIVPDANYFGNAFLNVTISDGEFSSSQLVPVNVESINDLPVITGIPDQSITIEPGTSRTLLLNIEDVETPKNLLAIGFIAKPDSLQADYNRDTNILTLSARYGFSGWAELTVFVLDKDLGFTSEILSVYVQPSSTGIDDDNGIPTNIQLSQNYPNPFNPSTIIRYQIPVVDALSCVEVLVSLKVYDLLGNEVANLQNGPQSPGYYERTWNAGDRSSGIYIYILRAGNFSVSKKMVLLR
ncbi:MAG: FG-GAP repeat protein [Bacteroidetes bacterium]|nr:FG-GAP repeat protein [Bacteroidota bacterium]